MTELKPKKPLPKKQSLRATHLPLPGTVHAQYVRCGRAGCRCAGGELHGPYYYRFWRDAGRLNKQYVNRADVADIRARCKAMQDQKALGRRIVRESRLQWRRLMAGIRQMEREC